VQEPLDRFERSSPGYGPGASPSTLERQRATAVPPDGRRLADVRRAVCRRASSRVLFERLLPSSRPNSFPAYQTGALRNVGPLRGTIY